ncbi:helix-turn-helix domain-containing protein [Streptomyces sp. TRM72054]|uniref:helix-turn-helix domain-containing protein n=1 Tax=Streptomyces sp. TRM72054 TaxID=2870562 RepID=UPI001C8B190D|nr:helix-turn-helix transcriptional regulator [Streptomyces sp. TRM72054]MBX9392210.1 helix-turn-helix domain-containing protein [Streptomyces sp. TRM72054]
MHQPPTIWVNGDAIREERLKAGLSQAQLAALVGVTDRYIRHHEKGTRRRMRRPTYFALRTALNATDERLRQPPPRPTEDHTPEGT